ncbi:L-cysteine desulfidase family protein [Pantoea sp. AS142]|uniref:L-cysteine desulfidase family protein n=1 Tax=Pantoea sp. AS142 TaxID=3081292 RepID=UPI003018E70A
MNNVSNAVLLQWLKQEVRPALGCTEPVAIAFAAATAGRHLGEPCVRVEGSISENLYKNAVAVTIPGTQLSGIEMAAAVGLYGGDPDRGLEMLAGLTAAQVQQAQIMVSEDRVNIIAAPSSDFIWIDLTVAGEKSRCRVVIRGGHTRITELYVNDEPVTAVCSPEQNATMAPLPLFSLRDAVDFAARVPVEDIAFMLEAARLNGALSEAGRQGHYGLDISGTFSSAVSEGLMSDDVLSRMLTETVAASDARMGGAPVAAMSNFGSGNQGIAATLPVMVLARELNADQETLVRALTLSHLVAISVHARYTRLSALCAASTAAMGAAAGMAWLFTRAPDAVEAAVINMVSDVSGMICDGASGSCAMKVSTATASAFRAALMARQGVRVGSSDGIVSAGAEQTVDNLCRLVVNAMPVTDQEIIRIMAEKNAPVHS